MSLKKKKIFTMFLISLSLMLNGSSAFAQNVTSAGDTWGELWILDNGTDSIRIEGNISEPAGNSSASGKEIIKSGNWSYTSDEDYQGFPPVYIDLIKKVPINEASDSNPTNDHRRRSLSSRSGAGNVKWIRQRIQEDISPIILKYARLYNVSPYIIKAVIEVESSFNPSAISTSGACGLMQLKPSTAYDMGVRNYWNPESNIEAGTKYLRLMLDTFGSLTTALAGYNQGPGAVQRAGGNPPNQSAHRYIWKVFKALEGQR